MRWRRLTAFVFGTVMTAYFVAILLVQRRVLFPMPHARPLVVRPPESSQVWLSTSVGAVEAWYLPPLATGTARAPVLVFFHGNGELIDFLSYEFQAPRNWGMGILLVEYPGYGRSAGSPSQASVTAAVLAAHDWLALQPSVDRGRVVAYGRSLGGGAAAILAAQRGAAALVLESTFTSVKSFAHRFWMPEFAILDPFDNLSAVQTYPGPVLVLHGEQDDLIPPAHAKALAQANMRSELHLLGCGHNDCERPWALIRKFLAANAIVSP
jgi:fermentation-respiration switch protein FrsA (DUF1100 family)